MVRFQVTTFFFVVFYILWVLYGEHAIILFGQLYITCLVIRSSFTHSFNNNRTFTVFWAPVDPRSMWSYFFLMCYIQPYSRTVWSWPHHLFLFTWRYEWLDECLYGMYQDAWHLVDSWMLTVHISWECHFLL